jgi:hypothetical protein
MSLRLFVLGMALTLMPALVLAQDAPKDATLAKTMRYITDLGSPDFQVREKATLELIRIGQPAVKELKKTRLSSDPEVKSRAKRILDTIAKNAGGASSKKAPPSSRARGPYFPIPGRNKDMERLLRELLGEGRKRSDPDKKGKDPFEELFRNFENLFKDRKGQDKAFGFGLEGFRQMRKRMMEQLERMGARARDGRRTRQSQTLLPGRTTLRYTFGEEEVEVTHRKDGSVTLKVTAQGKTRTYAAPSKEAFRKAHPDVARRYLLGGFPGQSFIFPWNGRKFGLDPTAPARPALPAPKEKKEIFGIRADIVSPVLQRHLGLGPNEGFLVAELTPHGQARAWGLDRFDIVLIAGKTPLSSLADLAAHLATLARGTEVTLTIVRRAQRRSITFQR